jgi:hypothetical protein
MKNKYVGKYQKIVAESIEKSFPRLRRKKIFLSEINIHFGNYSAIVNYFVFFIWIIVHPKVRKYSEPSIKALLAHELSHYEIIINMSFLKKISFAIKWLFTKKYKRNFERDADKYAIKKGYGKDLFNLRKESLKTYSKEESKKVMFRGYLTLKQIKSYARKIGKW